MRLKDKMSPRYLEDLEALSQDLARLALRPDNTDLVFLTGPEGTPVPVHVPLMAARCPGLMGVVSRGKQEGGGGGEDADTAAPHVRLDQVNTDVFLRLKQFVYSGRLELDGVRILDIFTLAITFEIENLKSLCLNHIKNSLTLSSVGEILNEAAALPSDAITKDTLVQPILEFIGDNIIALRERKLLNNLSKESLITLIKSNTLNINENEIWRLCAEWGKGLVGIPEGKDPSSWDEQERSSMRQALQGVVQHIRVLLIDSSVFAEEVEPTGAVPIELSLERYKQAALTDRPHPLNTGSATRVECARALPSRTDEPRFRGAGGNFPRKEPNTHRGLVQQRIDEASRVFPLKKDDLSGQQGHPQRGEDGPAGAGVGRNSQDLNRLNPRAEMDLRPGIPSPLHPQKQQQQAAYPGGSRQDHQWGAGRLIHGSAIMASLENSGSSGSAYYEKLLNSWAGSPGQAWTVIFRGSEQEFSAQAFHRMCDGASPSLVLVKADTGCIGGGFTDVPWARPNGKGRYMASDKSFLFSLYNSTRHPAKFNIKKKLFAVSHHPDCGPVFGAGADLFLSDRCHINPDSYSNLPHSYDGQEAGPDSILGDYNFIVEEYEVLVPMQN